MPFHDDLGPAGQIDTITLPLDVLGAARRDDVYVAIRAAVRGCGDR